MEGDTLSEVIFLVFGMFATQVWYEALINILTASHETCKERRGNILPMK